MPYTVTNLITDAYYASGIVSREFETVNGSQTALGLQVLNNILTDKAIEKDMIPYYLKYTFDAVPSQGVYFVPNLEEVDTLVFFVNSVRYQMRPVDRIAFKGSFRAENVTSLPFTWNIERCLGGSNISLYFLPDRAYPMEAWGLFRLSSVSLMQDLSFKGATAELGTLEIFGVSPDAGILTGGQLVVNGVDLMGVYNTGSDLANYINTGVIPGVRCTYVASKLTLINSETNSTILVKTNGTADPLTGLSFSDFSLTNGPASKTYISMGLDEFYVTYLKFALADRLCTEYNLVVPLGVEKQLEQYQRWISKRSGSPDLSLQKVSTLSGATGVNYAMVNLSGGWIP